MRDLLTWLRKFQQAADPGSVNRDWNVTTNTVITGQALMQLHGDWMKGEWRGAGKVAGTDFGCITPPGAKALSVTVDSWGLLGGQTPEKTAAELRFAAIVADPAVQADFAAIKGSTPTRLDAPADKLDICSQNVLTALADPATQVQNPNSMVDADWMSSLWDVYFAYWSDPSMTVDDAIAKIKENYDTILG
jgi:glucose/mannose transport system substrate-binding protein